VAFLSGDILDCLSAAELSIMRGMFTSVLNRHLLLSARMGGVFARIWGAV
jgi:hypothetical protein